VLLVGETYGKGDISILATSLVVILTDLQMDVPGILVSASEFIDLFSELVYNISISRNGSPQIFIWKSN